MKKDAHRESKMGNLSRKRENVKNNQVEVLEIGCPRKESWELEVRPIEMVYS